VHADGGVHMQTRSRCSQDDGATRGYQDGIVGRRRPISFSLIIASATRFVGLVLSRSTGRRLEEDSARQGAVLATCSDATVQLPVSAIDAGATLIRHTAQKVEASDPEFSAL